MEQIFIYFFLYMYIRQKLIILFIILFIYLFQLHNLQWNNVAHKLDRF